jgi:predicted metalloprotease with PDZ domain
VPSRRMCLLQFIGVISATHYLAAETILPISMPITSVRYDVTVDSAGTTMDKLKVEMSFSVASAGEAVLALPAWAPGNYGLKWFARRVSEFTALQNGKSLDWNKADPQTWRIKVPRPGRVQVSFRYLGDTIDFSAQYTRSRDFATLDGVGFCLYPVGRGFDWPAMIVIHVDSGARVLTGLQTSLDHNTWSAPTYHDLVDAPFFIGNFDIDSLKSGPVWIRIGSYPRGGSSTLTSRTKTLQFFSKLLPIEAAVFGEIPFTDYVVLQRGDPRGDNRGGIEHGNSQLVDLPEGNDWEGWRHFLYAHELFHAWNVKRLRPADLRPYRYDDMQPSPWLWVSEGLTSYYANVSLVRARLNEPAALFGVIASDIQQLRAAPPFAVTDASLSEWIQPVNGASGDYYAKGEVLGLLLDILIRDGSDNRHSLDDVMRTLYGSTYKKSRRGFTDRDWWGTASHLAGGRSFEDFNRRYVLGRDELPVDSVLALAGLALTKPKQPEITMTGDRDGDCLRVTSIVIGGAVEAAGIRAGDCVIAVAGVPIYSEYSLREVRARNADSHLPSLPVRIRRGKTTIDLPLPVRLVESDELAIKVLDGASSRARAIRDGILLRARSSP